jgi:hypothetical protein
MCLRWAAPLQEGRHVWRLPEGLSLTGPAPGRFGISIQRVCRDTYAVRLLWDRSCLFWHSLSRRDLIECDLGLLLTALGTDLWYLLDQPIEEQALTSPHAA